MMVQMKKNVMRMSNPDSNSPLRLNKEKHSTTIRIVAMISTKRKSMDHS